MRNLSARYGELDGEISYYYATHFADVGKTLTSEQKAKMIALRNLAGYTCEGAYLYSQPISMPQNIPSDFLFGSGTYDATAMTAWLQSQQQTTASPKPGQGQVQGNGKNIQGSQASNTGNTTQPKQGSGQGQNPQGRVSGNAGNTSQTGQERRMPIDAIIAQLGQKGYDVTGAATAIQSGDREAQKAWLDTFKKNNPGVAESIESSGTTNNPSQKAGTGTPPANEPPKGKGAAANTGILEALNDWFSNLGKSFQNLFSRGT